MLSVRKRKRPWSRSFFGSRSAKNVEIYEDPAVGDEQQKTDAPVPEIELVKKRRTLFSTRRTLDGVQASNDESSTPGEREKYLATVPEATVAVTPVLTEAHFNVRGNLLPLQTHGKRVDTPTVLSSSSTRSNSTVMVNMPYRYVMEPRVVPLNISPKSRERSGLRHVQSASDLAHQLSHKISYTFGNPTVIHRPKKARPSVIGLQQTPQFRGEAFARLQQTPQVDGEASTRTLQGSQGDGKASTRFQQGSQVTSDPSSNTNSGSSPEETSTEKTSIESQALLAALRHRDLHKTDSGRLDSSLEEARRGEADLADFICDPSPVPVSPTILTVEMAASAKIFFESHFNSLFSEKATPRSLRRMELETLLHSELLTAEEKQLHRLAWAKQESANLRLSRVQRSKSRPRARGYGITVAGYEVVRILGKGSFGVVRLVREKGKSSSESSATAPVRRSSSFPREEIINLRKAAFKAVRRTRESWSGSPPISPRPKSPRLHKVRREVFAMKVIRKSDMLKNCQESHLRAERDFLVASEKSQWVVPLIAAFQDQTNLYLVMEYMIGGDFLGLLIRYERLKERVTRWYMAEMILCIEEAHRLRWIHRDVKPDNFLISSSGHLKISDFGLAFNGHWSHDKTYFNNHRYSLLEKLGIKVDGDSEDRKENKARVAEKISKVLHPRRTKRSLETERHQMPEQHSSTIAGIVQWRDQHGRRKLAESTVGTSQYMAPEVIRGDQYDGRCDWWSIGIILYECLYGFTPFLDEDRTATKIRILKHHEELYFPRTASDGRRYRISYDAKELINSLLQEKEVRLCSKQYFYNDYKHHPRTPGAITNEPANPRDRDYKGLYVYPNDAVDIKKHPFFDEIDWETIHLSKPPEVPKVSGKDDTHYFDEEAAVSDPEDEPSVSSVDEDSLRNQEAFEEQVAADFYAGQHAHPDNSDTTVFHPRDADGAEDRRGKVVTTRANTSAPLLGKKSRRARDKKRPRDRILRDKTVAKQVLQLRKTGAFWGYSYRRPRRVIESIQAFGKKAGWESGSTGGSRNGSSGQSASGMMA